MEQLSSCYFCGGALDASLDEYPVVPKELHPAPDDQKTVVLCQGCRQKLGTVVETIVSVAEKEAVEEGDVTGAGSAGSAASAPSADDSGTDEWVSADTLANDATRESDGTDPLTEDAAEVDVEERESAAEASDDGEAAAGDSSADAAGYSEGRSAGNATTGGDDRDDDRPSLSALENTKVMRLLQNREFPVDREEIRTVAVNAYDLSESQFDTVVDAAVERGLIGEENGKFVEGN